MNGKGVLKKYVKFTEKIRRDVINFCVFDLLPKTIIHPRLMFNGHILRILHNPLNYIRRQEIPLTMYLLKPKVGEEILDISSPKLLSIYLIFKLGLKNVTMSDIDDYFVKDVDQFSKLYKSKCFSGVFDARELPYDSNSFCKIFSISVLEHIPGKGDIEAIKEMARVLKVGGEMVITVPTNMMYIEEYLKKASFYWKNKSIKKDDKVFFQRRYDPTSILNRLTAPGLRIKKIIYLCEKRIKRPIFNKNGRFLYNNYFLDRIRLVNYIPFLRYILDGYVSNNDHYYSLTPSPDMTHAIIHYRKINNNIKK